MSRRLFLIADQQKKHAIKLAQELITAIGVLKQNRAKLNPAKSLMNLSSLDLRHTAPVLIDLQRSVSTQEVLAARTVVTG